MKKYTSSIFTSIAILVFALIFTLGILFIIVTYLSATNFYQDTTQRLNKDVAAHIAKFTSPFGKNGLDKKIADSVFYDAMVLSPNIEVYFLDTVGNVIYFQAPDSAIKLRRLPLENIKNHILSQGMDYIKGPDPKNPGKEQIFSAAEVNNGLGKMGYIYVVLGSNEYRKVSESLFENHVVLLSLKVFTIVIFLSLIVSLLYLSRIRRNFKRITTVLNQFSKGDYKARLQMNNYNEFSSIADGFNSMADMLVLNIEKLERSAKERKDFLANISHDLRTPLTIAKGYLETLHDELHKDFVEKARREEFVKMAYKKIQQLDAMVGQLFELSRMESVEFIPVKEPFIISDILEETVNAACKTAREKNISITCTGCQDSYWINGDIGMMERVIQNLVDNAVKYTPPHGIIHVSLVKNITDLEVIVENSGPPPSPALFDWISSTKTAKTVNGKPHSGLGIAIVIKILQLHGYQYKACLNEKGQMRFSFSMTMYS
ncbi:MAG: HAMP domain-containing sensor histidine kinase [Bacteroidota bacterium]